MRLLMSRPARRRRGSTLSMAVALAGLLLAQGGWARIAAVVNDDVVSVQDLEDRLDNSRDSERRHGPGSCR